MIKLALADDHELIRKSLADMLRNNQFVIAADAGNGKELIQALQKSHADVVLMDVNMPEMDGVEATSWLREHMPDVRVIALSMMDDDMSVIRMVKAGARGYLLKNARPNELMKAIREVYERGYHYSDLMTGKLINSVSRTNGQHEGIVLSDRDVIFLRHCCSEMSYKEIAHIMHASPRTVEGYRDQLCARLNLKTRVGLVLYAVKNQIYQG